MAAQQFLCSVLLYSAWLRCGASWVVKKKEVVMKDLPKKLLPLTLFAIAVTSLFSVQSAQAFTMTLEQVGLNVVATGSGAFNLMGLTSQGIGMGGVALVQANTGLIQIGAANHPN